MRAMSLAADEGEGEQMELRTLQEQLMMTQSLILNLSQQLNELKDQVRRTFDFLSILFLRTSKSFKNLILPSNELKGQI